MSSFFGAGRRLGVLIYGDDRQLQKTLSRTETRLAAFGRKADTIGRGGILGGGGKAFAGFAGAGAAALTIQKFISASRDAEVVLGQTSVAVKNAGIAWEQNAGKINAAATRISEASGLDDEDVLRSFQVFVRGQKDVAKSINLAQLAADVARGRYTDLASATQLVNKASMGQIGALRRAGIAIDKNATATQALTALQKAYGGAAVKYANSAAGAADNLSVAWENLAEVAGGPLSNALAKVANGLTFVVKQMTGVQNSAELTKATLSDPKFIQALQALNGAFKGIGLLNQLQAQQIVAPGEGAPRPTGGGNQSTAKAKPASLVTGIPARLEDNLLNARISGNDQAIKAALEAEAKFIQTALQQKKLNRKQRVGLKEALISITDEINGINEAAAQAAQAAADATKQAADESKRAQKDAAQKAKDAAKRAAEAAKKAAQALKDQGQALKDAALARLDAVQNNRDTLRDLADAKTDLRHARMIGGKRGVLEASRNLQDAELARKRFLLEQSTATPAGKTAAAGFNFAGATLNFHGVQNVQQLMAEITKLSKKSATQRRGRNGGVPHGA